MQEIGLFRKLADLCGGDLLEPSDEVRSREISVRIQRLSPSRFGDQSFSTSSSQILDQHHRIAVFVIEQFVRHLLGQHDPEPPRTHA